MLFEAFYWDSESPRPPFEEFSSNLLDNWGRDGDLAIIAEEDGQPAGAAWCRLWTDEDHSYGYVDAETAELGLAVDSKYRSRGIGRALLRELIRRSPRLSLSVDPKNPARRLYESEGFVKTGESGTSWTYKLART